MSLTGPAATQQEINQSGHVGDIDVVIQIAVGSRRRVTTSQQQLRQQY